MIPGVVGSSQYVLPFANVKTVTYGNSASVPSIPPASDGTTYYAYDNDSTKIKQASTYPSEIYFDKAPGALNATNNLNNNATYENGRFFFTNFSAGHIYTWVNPGDSVTTVTIATPAPRIIKWFAPMNAWVGVGSTGVVFTSTNGTTWTSRTAPTTSNLNALATDGTTLVAAGQNGVMFTTTSTNPASITWTSRTSSFGSTDITTVQFKNENWVASADAGLVAYSTNGTSWTQKTTGIPTGAGSTGQAFGLYYHMGKWTIVTRGTAGSNDSALAYSNTSNPSGSWTVASTTSPAAAGRTFSDGKYLIWVTRNGVLRYCR